MNKKKISIKECIENKVLITVYNEEQANNVFKNSKLYFDKFPSINSVRYPNYIRLFKHPGNEFLLGNPYAPVAFSLTGKQSALVDPVRNLRAFKKTYGEDVGIIDYIDLDIVKTFTEEKKEYLYKLIQDL